MFGCGGPLELITPGDWDWVIGVNLMGFVHVIQAFLPRLKEQGEGGHIVTTSSVAGFACPPGTGPYNAAKFANDRCSGHPDRPTRSRRPGGPRARTHIPAIPNSP